MRKFVLLLTAVAVLGATLVYATAPLVSAVRLRHAIATGDASTVQRMIEWTSFRASLRSEIARNADLLPAAKDAARAVRPTLWQRVRSLFGHTMLDRFIETHVTPEGLTRLYQARQRRAGAKQQAFIKAGISLDQLLDTWSHVKRAEFLTPGRFVLELEDALEPGRRIRSLFILDRVTWTGFEWKLYAVAIERAPTRR